MKDHGIQEVSIVLNNQKKRDLKDAEAHTGLTHLMDDHWSLELQDQINKFDKFITFKVSHVNMPVAT